MKNFYDQFRENLENRKEPEFDKKLWQKLEKDLDKQVTQKKTFLIGWWTVAAVVSLLLAANLLSLREVQKFNQTISSLEQKTDTIFLTDVQTKLVYRTDTIIQIKTIQKEIIKYLPTPLTSLIVMPNELTFFEKTNKEVNTGLILPYEQALQEQGFSNNLFTEYLAKKEKEKEQFRNTKNIYKVIGSLTKLDIESIPYSMAQFVPDATLTPYSTSRKKTFPQHLYAMRPKGIRIGLSGGMATLLNEDLENLPGLSTSVDAAFIFSTKLHLWLTGTFQQAHIATDKLDSSLGLPTENPPSDEFTFAEAEANFSFLRYSAGLQYFFNDKHKWKPFIGFGFESVSQLASEIDYNFEIEDQDIEITIQKSITKQSQIPNLLFRAGVEYQIKGPWSAQLRVDYHKNLEKNKSILESTVNVQAGLQYNF